MSDVPRPSTLVLLLPDLYLPSMAVCKHFVQPALVTAAMAFDPFQQVGITQHGKLLLGGTTV